jgi:hypothetical protein
MSFNKYILSHDQVYAKVMACLCVTEEVAYTSVAEYFHWGETSFGEYQMERIRIKNNVLSHDQVCAKAMPCLCVTAQGLNKIAHTSGAKISFRWGEKFCEYSMYRTRTKKTTSFLTSDWSITTGVSSPKCRNSILSEQEYSSHRGYKTEHWSRFLSVCSKPLCPTHLIFFCIQAHKS